MPAVVAAVVPAGGPAKEKSGEEDHRDDEHDTGDDPYPRKSLGQSTNPGILLALTGPCLAGYGGAFSRRLR
jgi:hypothetical protein